MTRKRRQHAADARSRRPRYQPTVVEDLDSLLAAVESFINVEESRADTTRRTDESNWSRWEDHCATVSKAYKLVLPIDAMNAPWWVFKELCLELREDGKPLAKGYVQHIAAAMQLKYEARTDGGPTVAPYKRPEHVAEWRQLLEGKGRREADRRANGDPPQKPVTPLLREPLLQMLQAEPPRTPRQAVTLAVVLLAFDTDLSAPRLQVLEPGGIELLGDDDPDAPGGIRVTGVDEPLPCDHRERVRGVPWDCTACAVRAVLAAHAGTGPLFAAGDAAGEEAAETCHYPGCTRGRAQRTTGTGRRPLYCGQPDPVTGQVHDRLTARKVRQQTSPVAAAPAPRPEGPIDVNTLLVHRRRSSAYLQRWVAQRGGSALTPVDGLHDWQLAGLRRGLALGAGYEEHLGFCWVRARAWTATAWVAGFRMISDLSDLERDRVEPGLNEDDGYAIRLRGTKDDAPGAKRVTRPLEWSATGGPSPAQAMAEYLCVRDAAVGGRHGALLLTSSLRQHRSLVATASKAKEDLDLLCRFAGLPDGVYSSYSTRKGYGQQAHLDGWEPEQIQEGLRHQRLDTTRLYAGSVDARAAAKKLMGDGSTADGSAEVAA